MDRQCDYHIPGSLLGCLRHRAEGRIRRWRKLPPEAGAVTVADTGVNSDADPEPDSVGDAVTGAVAVAVADTDSNPGANSVGVANAQCDTDSGAVADTNAKCDTDSDTIGVADPNKGSGGRRAPRPAAAQAAGRRAGAHRHQRRPAD